MILLATASSDLVSFCCNEFQHSDLMLTVANYGSLKEALLYVKPDVVLLDLNLPQLDGATGIASMRRINPESKPIVLTSPLPDDVELRLFIAGARGCCGKDPEPGQLTRVVDAVRRGELWLRRSLTPRLLDELGARDREEVQPTRLTAGRLVELTQREREIASLVGGGNSNKQIARRLDISERTVKAHLTEIFRKLGVHDRLMLALRVLAQAESDHDRITQ